MFVWVMQRTQERKVGKAVQDALVEYTVLGGFYGGLLAFLYWRVRRNIHPSRSAVLGFLATLGVMLGGSIASILFMLVVAAATNNLSNPNQPISPAIIGLGVGGVFGSIIFGWQFSKSWLSRPRAERGAQAEPEVMTASLASLPSWAWKTGIGIGLLVIAAAALRYYLQPKSYDECILAEMRGQTRHLYPNAEKVCTERFGKPIDWSRVIEESITPTR